ncbi:hypothetical protein D2T29_21940 [Sinirhodobacter populi]|uniref:Uncharacterized protein n=1 Tax=Paenirhodobacter populi TaxID=2306993 RepID=A0A443JYD5_9RHOB|nr:hypothetical protein [Sinirhodobacter populi]RWR25518.1 hypothetical protein D2T29_21940 [Sinirhodobacter populi]
MTFGKELNQSAKEALAIAEGKAAPAAIYRPQEAEVAAIQERVRKAGFKRLPDEKPFLDDLSGGL